MAFETEELRRNRNIVSRQKLTLTGTATSVSTAIPINGFLMEYIIVAPNLTTDADYDFTIDNEDGKNLYTNGTISDNATTTLLMSDKPVPMSGTMTFKCAFTTSQTVTFTIYLYYS
jgi:hypothetical protein